MIKTLTVTLLTGLIISGPVFADSSPSGVASDAGAIQKDNAAIGNTNADLAKDRAAKAQDKVNSNMGDQAVDSMKVGVDKAKKVEKGTEKDADKKILNHDVNSATGN